VKLPAPVLKGQMSLEETLVLRRSKRRFAHQSLNWEQISQLLWAAQGVTDEVNGFRTAPSAGALLPMEVYLAIEDGTYHYEPQGHEVEQTSTTDKRAEISRAAIGQPWVQEAAADIVVAAVYEKVSAVYGERAKRLIDIEAGHVAQNLHLQAVALGLGSVPIGAFNRDEVQKILALPGDHKPVYIVSVGYLLE
jgi:SagB-type dehydrogenase family enzyme